MIDITGVDLVEFAKKVYELSVPQGLGFIHFTAAPLTEYEAKQLVAIWKDDKQFALGLDYVKGRACKMNVWRKEGKLEIRSTWYDHTDRIFAELLKSFGIQVPGEKKHNIACGCMDCESARAQT